MILLNKTQIYGTDRNGDSKLYLNVQPNSTNTINQNYNYTKWIYPSASSHHAHSWSENYNQPEIIQVCAEYLRDRCEANECALVVGVAGKDDKLASYRLKGFRTDNFLKAFEPRNSSTLSRQFNGSFYDYFWFVINDTVLSPANTFEYHVSVATDEGKNPDLFVSLMDGRDPTDQDYEFASEMFGSDSVKISSKQTIWAEKGWNTSSGVTVVAAVKKPAKDTPYRILLTNLTNYRPDFKRIEVNDAYTVDQSYDNVLKLTKRYFQFFNWEHKDVTVTLTMMQSAKGFRSKGKISYQRTGQKYNLDNIFTAIPYTNVTAKNSTTVNELQSKQLVIKGGECFACWYFFIVEVDNPAHASYRLSFQQNED